MVLSQISRGNQLRFEQRLLLYLLPTAREGNIFRSVCLFMGVSASRGSTQTPPQYWHLVAPTATVSTHPTVVAFLFYKISIHFKVFIVRKLRSFASLFELRFAILNLIMLWFLTAIYCVEGKKQKQKTKRKIKFVTKIISWCGFKRRSFSVKNKPHTYQRDPITHSLLNLQTVCPLTFHSS